MWLHSPFPWRPRPAGYVHAVHVYVPFLDVIYRRNFHIVVLKNHFEGRNRIEKCIRTWIVSKSVVWKNRRLNPSLVIVCAGLLIKYGAAPGTEKRAIPHFAPMFLERQRKYTRRATFWTVWTESLQNIAEFLPLPNVAHLPASGKLKFGKLVRAKPKLSAIARF